MTDATPSRSEMSWHVAVNTDGGVVIAKIMHASIGHDEATAIHTKMHEVLADVGKKLKALALDLSEVTFMNSMAVGMCIDLRNTAEKTGADTFIIGLTPELRGLLATVKVDTLFKLVANADAVRKSIR